MNGGQNELYARPLTAAEMAAMKKLRMACACWKRHFGRSLKLPMHLFHSDFGDPESERVLDVIADALITHLAVQWAREDHEEWLATQKVRR